MPETTPLIKAALNLRVGAGFDVYNFTSTELILCKNYFPYTKRRRANPRLLIDNPYNVFKAQLRQRQARLLFRQMRYLSADYISRHTH